MKKNMPAYLAEMFGTFLLCFVGASSICLNSWTGQPGLLGIALAHGIALSIAVTAAMNISGGHINPAVTLAMMATKRIAPQKAVGYIVFQLLGAVIAGILVNCFFGPIPMHNDISTSVAAAAKLGTPYFDPAVLTPLRAITVELVLTFILVFAIFGTAVDERAPKIGGFGIGLAITCDILAAGPLTGAAMNPARVFGTLFAGCHATQDLWAQHYVYWLGPVLGALFAAWVYDRFILKKR